VLTQTRPPDEIIVIDDGSTDETLAVASRYPMVRYRWQTNRGQSAARNHGIRASHGNYLIFLDADDRLLPNHLRLALDAFAEHPDAGFVCGDYRMFGIGDDRHRHDCRPRPDHYATLLQIRDNFIAPPAGVMFRRAALVAVGAWRENQSANPDIDLFLRVARDFHVVCHHQVVAEYRRHPAQLTQKLDLMLASIMQIYQAHRPYIESRPEYWAAYRNGVEMTRTACAVPLAWQMVEKLREGHVVTAWRYARVLMRYYPGEIMKLLAHKTRRVMRIPARAALKV
jgi:glycosyltransferase involved in cell wall biosynthesis